MASYAKTGSPPLYYRSYLGWLGADRFYLGRAGTAVLKLLTFGGFGIWTLIDFIMIATKNIRGVVWENDDKEAQKKAWIIFAIVVIVGLFAAVGSTSGSDTTSNRTGQLESTSSTAADQKDIESGSAAPVDTDPTPTTTAKAAAPSTPAAQPSVPAEYKSALAKAKSYSNVMHMSKQGIYDQLTSDYGEKFSAAAAQYAVDTIQADWNANALQKAKTYQEQMSMSPSAIRDQLTSSYGEKFTAAEADYAIQHLND